jgi:hypothetical protein
MSRAATAVGFLVLGVMSIIWGVVGFTDVGFDFMWPSAVAYVVMQALVIWRARRLARLVVGLPLVFMVPVFALTFYGIKIDSNLWFIFLSLATPVALVCVGIAAIAVRRLNAIATPV